MSGGQGLARQGARPGAGEHRVSEAREGARGWREAPVSRGGTEDTGVGGAGWASGGRQRGDVWHPSRTLRVLELCKVRQPVLPAQAPGSRLTTVSPAVATWAGAHCPPLPVSKGQRLQLQPHIWCQGPRARDLPANGCPGLSLVSPALERRGLAASVREEGARVPLCCRCWSQGTWRGGGWWCGERMGSGHPNPVQAAGRGPPRAGPQPRPEPEASHPAPLRPARPAQASAHKSAKSSRVSSGVNTSSSPITWGGGRSTVASGA